MNKLFSSPSALSYFEWLPFVVFTLESASVQLYCSLGILSVPPSKMGLSHTDSHYSLLYTEWTKHIFKWKKPEEATSYSYVCSDQCVSER